MIKIKERYRSRDISWLYFNARVLQEAADPGVPLIERFKFLGIVSSNLDEFFRVRVATLQRMIIIHKKAKPLLGLDPKKILNQINEIVIKQQIKFEQIYRNLLKELERQGIFIIDEKQLNKAQGEFVKSYFQREVRPSLVPIMLDNLPKFSDLKDHSIYLAVRLSKNNGSKDSKSAIIEIPSGIIPRFLVLPKVKNKNYIILLDDVIRYCLEDIFSTFDFNVFESHTIKLTRDAELDIDNEITVSFIEKIAKSVKKRKIGDPVRFIYDKQISKRLLNLLIKKLGLKKNDTMIPSGRYHNFKDFIDFPPIGSPDLRYAYYPPLQHHTINPKKSLINTISEKDIMMHFPYHSFHYITDLLREAAIDPLVKSIKITLYRVAKHSNVVNALINAVKNGKSVTVVMELQARFDEESNIYWANRLIEEGARVIYGVPGLKVHAKLCLISRIEEEKIINYAIIGTGNLNETTAKIYSDESLFTSDERITDEVKKVFSYFEDNSKIWRSQWNFKHLLISPFYMRKHFITLIDNEIKNSKKGKKAFIIVKVNSLSDQEMIEKLYDASRAGVQIKLIVRGIFSLMPGVKKISERIQAVSIIDKYLEHSRIFVFCNNGKEKYYISSADWMTRNLDFRVEVACPIYDKELQDEIKRMLTIQLNDNTKARILNKNLSNRYNRKSAKNKIRAQIDIYTYLQSEKIS